MVDLKGWHCIKNITRQNIQYRVEEKMPQNPIISSRHAIKSNVAMQSLCVLYKSILVSMASSPSSETTPMTMVSFADH